MCCGEDNLDDDLDDCYQLDTIFEQVYEFDEFYDCGADDYWEKGWTINSEGFYCDDSDVYDGREVRVFPTRYRLEDFILTKSLRRILKKNADLKILVRPFRATKNKDNLFTAHLTARFEPEKPHYSLKNSYRYLAYSDIRPMEVSVFRGRQLLACSTFLVGKRSVVGRRGFWDVNEPKRSLGILTALVEMQYAIRRRKKFYYLGNFFHQNPNYQYKTRLPALELWDWDNGAWVDFKSPRIPEMFNHRFRCRDDISEKDPKFTVSLLQTATSNHPDIAAAALIGSRARGTEREDSDYDLIILTENREVFFNDSRWVNRFHRWRESKTEERGVIKTLRAFYKNGDEYEFNFAPLSWANITPIDAGTRRIVTEGMKILHDPQGILEKLQKAVMSDTK